MGFEERLNDIRVRYEILCQKLLDPGNLLGDLTKISKEQANLEPIFNKINEYFAVRRNLEEARELLDDRTIDTDFRKVVEEEITKSSKTLPVIRRELEIFLLPRDEADEKSAILEIRAGTGGDEAALFGADLMKMYQKYAEKKRWKFELMNISENDLGGVKEAVILIKGKNVFRQLKFESGVHRVQRV
ncbi:MAG: PCRF domain-containing protein, partial [Rickettsiales bacterium]|nr:PCRF domain-containing protein [Rickettsiales bacterium]